MTDNELVAKAKEALENSYSPYSHFAVGAALLSTEPEDLGKLLYRSVDNPIPPVLTDKKPLCQEVVHKATDEDFDLYKLVPAPTNTPDDAGPYITLGMCYASHPDTG